jgi:hypothetical protein
MGSWVNQELAGSAFADERLGKRFGVLMEQLSKGLGRTLPLACGDWASTKAAYRFLDNDRVSEQDILAGHFQATQARFAAVEGPILVLHDTTEFSFTRSDTQAIGQTHKVASGQKDQAGRQRLHTVCGILMHSSLAVTTDGLPLGLAAVKLWTRKKFKGANALKGRGPDGGKHSVNATRIPIEEKESIRWLENTRQSAANLGDAGRCVHIGDRESDICELFSECQSLETKFVFRTCVDRRSGEGEQTVAEAMQKQPVQAVHRVEVMDAKGRSSTAVLEIKYHRLQVCPPIGKEKRYGPLTLTVIHARERGTPKDRDTIDWKLITNLPVTSKADAIQMLDWYALRWKIETFHKILKSGCRAEDSKLRTAERLANLIAILCILAWRVLWLCMGQFLLAEISATDALVGRVSRFSAAGHLTGVQGEAYLADLAKTSDTPPDTIMRQMLRYTMKMNLLGQLRSVPEGEGCPLQFLVGERAFVRLGCRVRIPRKRPWGSTPCPFRGPFNYPHLWLR